MITTPNLPTIDELTEHFQLFDDWEDRYRYVIELGQQLPPLDAAYKRDEFKVNGCTSQVWLVPQQHDAHWQLHGDSDAAIVKGLVAIVLSVYSGKTTAEIQAIDAKAVFEKLQLAEHLSPTRSNGFFAMVKQIQSLGIA